MGIHWSVSVCFLVSITCSTALPSLVVKSSESTVSSTAAGDSAKTVTTSASIPSVTSHEPCFLASSAIASFSSLNPSVPVPTIPAEIAYNCLQSIPLVKKDALQLVTNLAPYFELQSTIGFLKDPPSGYLLPGVDLMGGLARIESHVRDGVYTSEYDFELDLYTLVLSAHDGHFNYYPDIFSRVFVFRRTQILASVSRDGLDLPKIYLQKDLNQNASGSFSPSPVVLIDGKDAVTFLQDWAFGTLETQDPDAAYNGLFSSYPAQSIGGNSLFTSSFLYPGETTTFSFENGTTKSFPNIAVSLFDLKGIRSGQDLYTKVLDAEVSSTTSTSSKSTKTDVPLPTGYPLPVVKHPLNLISGFFLENSVYSDVAVLSVLSFENGDSNAQAQEFQDILQEFLAKAKNSKKTKLIIDLQANAGGIVSLGVELFAQLFPSLPAYSGRNFRANKANDVFGQIISGLEVSSQAYNNFTSPVEVVVAASPYNYRQDVLPDGSDTYESWSEVFGPVVTSRDNLTNIFRSNYSDPLWAALLVNTGTGNRTDFEQPFATEDIVILSDGNCASTCALFSEYMKTQVGVPTIVAGGRPQYGPMQGVGGVKGAQVQEFRSFANGIELAFSEAPLDLLEQLNNTFIGELNLYPANRSTSTHFNYLNNIRRGDTSVTPLQFVYEAADCRIFYTAEMHANVSNIWTRVADMAFGKSLSPQQDWARNPYCVRNSTGHRSSVSGGGPNNTDYAGSAPPAGAKSQAQLPLLSDGTRMGWRLDLPAMTNGSSTNTTGSYTGATSPLPFSSSATQRVPEKFHGAKILAAGLSVFFCFMLI